jgi:YD repeat-containing protein
MPLRSLIAAAVCRTLLTPWVAQSLLSNDASGMLARITDPLGRTVRFTYDANTNLISVSDPRSNITQFAYDEYHQITNAIDPRGNAFVSMVYDQQRRVVSSQKMPCSILRGSIMISSTASPLSRMLMVTSPSIGTMTGCALPTLGITWAITNISSMTRIIIGCW